MTKRVAILISGGGSNMVSLVKSMTGDHPARPVLVFSNRPDAGGLQKAADLGVPTACVDHKPFGKDRAAFEIEMGKHLEAAKPDIVCLAGFMRIFTPEFTQRWTGKMLNIHPSLLPKYKGLKPQLRALEAGETEAGCSVHHVTAELDAGDVFGQARVPVLPSDTEDTLSARILQQEHILYPEALRRFAAGDLARFELG